MYVCICNALTDRRIRGAIDSGAASLGSVYRNCGVAPQCGKCGEMIRSFLDRDGSGEAPQIGPADARHAVS